MHNHISCICFEVCLQRACLRGGKVTLVTFVWFFFNVYFQKCPQMARMRGCIVTLIAFVWLYDFYILHPLNQPYYFQEFVPLPLSDMIFVTSNACKKNYQHFGKIFLSECIFGTCMCVSFLLIFSHENKWQSVKWASMYKILILSSHFRLRKLRSSYQGTKNVVIYAFSSGKILDVRIFAGVKDLLRNIMSGHFVYCSWPKWLHQLS